MFEHILGKGVFQSFDLLLVVGSLLDEVLLVVQTLSQIVRFIREVFVVKSIENYPLENFEIGLRMGEIDLGKRPTPM